MWKKLLSLNLALVMALSLAVPTVPALAYDADAENKGYAVYYPDRGSEAGYEASLAYFVGSSENLSLYAVTPDALSKDGKVIVGFEDENGVSHPLSQKLKDAWSTDEDAPAKLYAQWAEAPENYILYINTEGWASTEQDYRLVSGLSGETQLVGADTFTGEKGKRSVAWQEGLSWDSKSYPAGAAITTAAPGMTIYSVMGVKAITYHYRDWKGKETEELSVYKEETDSLADSASWLSNSQGLALGWNSKADGSGDWYAFGELAVSAPADLYAQYGDYPDGPYCTLYCFSGLENGQVQTALPLTDGKADLPRQVKNGQVVYWKERWDANSCIPCGTSSAPEGEVLVPITHKESGRYAIVDGGEGTTSSGERYRAAAYDIATDGDLQIRLMDLGDYDRVGYALSGYRGDKTGKSYAPDTKVTAAVEAEMDGNHAARFTAEYQQVSGHYVRYFSNGADGYFVQEPEAGDAGVTVAENTFTPPEGERFLGWNTEADGFGTWYDPGTELTLTENVDLYAQWGHHRTTYHLGDKISVSRSDFAEYVEEADCGGDLFDGWNTEADGAGRWYLPGETLDEDVTVTELYAQLSQLPTEGYYYVLQGRRLENGRLNQIISMAEETAAVTLPGGGLGWVLPQGEPVEEKGFLDQQSRIAANHQTAKVRSGDKLTQFLPYRSTVYHSNTGEAETVRTYYLLTSHGDLQVLEPEQVFAQPEDKAFQAWNTARDGNGTAYAPGDEAYGNELNLYAIWKSTTGGETGGETGGGTTGGGTTGGGTTGGGATGGGATGGGTAGGGAAGGGTTGGSSAGAETKISFADVKKADWFYQDVRYAVEQGWMTGIGENRFAPETETTRSMLVTILWRLAGSPAAGKGAAFADVPADAWYAAAVDWANEAGIAAGYDAAAFGPADALTREQLATLLYRYGKSAGLFDGEEDGTDLSGYQDAGDISSFARAAMEWAVDAGLVTGMDGGRLAPGELCSRAQAAAVLRRFCAAYLSEQA